MNPIMRFLKTTFLNHCPNCGQSRLYTGIFQIRPKATCDNCSVRFERDAGNWLMPTALAYTAGAAFALILGFFLVKQRGFFAGLEWILIVATLAFVALIYKSTKSLWIWMLWLMGQVRVDNSG